MNNGENYDVSRITHSFWCSRPLEAMLDAGRPFISEEGTEKTSRSKIVEETGQKTPSQRTLSVR